MRIAVTGATGLVGQAIAERLEAKGHEAVGIGRRAPESQVREHLALDIGRPGAGAEIAAGLGRCDAMVHAAAAISRDPLDQELALANCLGTQEVLRAARELGTDRFVFISSIQVVGKPGGKPIEESDPPDPPTAYHASKLFGEVTARQTLTDGARYSVLRISSPVGGSAAGASIVPAFVRLALRDEQLTLLGRGGRRQDYVDVRDVGDAVGLALESAEGGLMNIASGRPTSNSELAETCVEALGSSSPIAYEGTDPEEEDSWEISVDRARERLGWQPARSLRESIQAMAADAP